MPDNPPGATPKTVPLSPRLTLHSPASWQVIRSDPLVLGDEEGLAPGIELDLFHPAEPPIPLVINQTPAPTVLGEDAAASAELTYQPTEKAVYVLLQEVHTPDGVVYDWTLPKQSSSATQPQVLGDELPAALVFPVHPVLGSAPKSSPSGAAQPAVLGISDVVVSTVSDVVAKRVLRLLKSPIDSALFAGVRKLEAGPRMLVLRDSFQPLEGFDAWRALLPPGYEHRVLLNVHGFGSSTAGGGSSKLVPRFASQYAAVLSYDHPTLSYDPLENAQALLDQIPDDLRLSVDIVAHSRGGLVARSLVELLDWQPKFRPVRLITAGSPHAGTRLADPERWSQLVSMAMTLASWLATIGGGAFWAPKLLEYVLKAAAQSFFALPGLAAMTPGGPFLQQLNAANASDIDERVHYSAVTSAFAIDNVVQQGFQQAFAALAAQVFLGEPNDLVVMTNSALEIDKSSRTLAPDQQFKATVDHGSYFQDARVIDFITRQLTEYTRSG